MGVSTNGQIAFGIPLEEDAELPWDDHEDGLEGWWREQTGWKEPFPLWDATGNYVGGVKPPEEKIGKWFDYQHKWDEGNPVPIKLVNVCSGDCPMWMLASNGTVRKAFRGYPERFDPSELKTPEDEGRSILDFCERYGIEVDASKVGWYLSSYWG